ncbi:hypothetical protein FHS85_005020 [Rhodoligotrophos appendicifer]
MNRLIKVSLGAMLAVVPGASLSIPAFAKEPELPVACASVINPRSGSADGELRRAEVQRPAPLRSGPNSSCEITYRVPPGGTVDLFGCEEGWCHVSYGTEAGFVPMAWLDPIPDRTPDFD